MKNLYIVTKMFPKDINQDKEIYIGFIQYREIPKSSILFRALQRGELAYNSGEGVDGIYYKRKYAVEHIRLEKRFRKACKQNCGQYKITHISS
jgi:hypothetical protein